MDYLRDLEYGKILTIGVVINDENFNTGKSASCDVKKINKFCILDKV